MTGVTSLSRPVARTIADIAYALDNFADADSALDKALGLLRDVLPYDACTLYLVEPPSGVQALRTTAAGAVSGGPALARMMAPKADFDDDGAGGSGAGIAGGSWMSMPLVRHGEISGLLHVETATGRYDDEDLAMLAMAAAHIAAFLAGLELYRERIRSQDELWLVEQRFRTAVEPAPINVFNQDLDLRYTWVAKGVPGFPPEAILGKTDGELLPPEVATELTRVKRQALDTGQGVRVDVTAHALDDPGLADYDLVIEPLRDREGNVLGITCVALDISDRVELNRALREFMAVTSHDLRNPLTIILGYAQALKRQFGQGQMAAEAIAGGLDAIISNTRRMMRVIEDLSSAANIGFSALRLELEQIDLASCITAVVGALQPADKQRVIVALPGAEVSARCDRGHVENVLRNLIENALKYSPEGLPVTVDVAVKDSIVVTVSDSGPGVSPEDVDRVFQRGFRTRGAMDAGVPGSGLGLFICRGIVEAHGGRIWVESRPDGRQGACFRVALPSIVES